MNSRHDKQVFLALPSSVLVFVMTVLAGSKKHNTPPMSPASTSPGCRRTTLLVTLPSIRCYALQSDVHYIQLTNFSSMTGVHFHLEKLQGDKLFRRNTDQIPRDDTR